MNDDNGDHLHDYRVSVCLTERERDALETASKRAERSMSWICRAAIVAELDAAPTTGGDAR